MKGFERFALPVLAELREAEERIADLREALTRGGAPQKLSLTYVQPAAEHLFRSQGKLLRPLLLLLAARSMGPLRPGARERIVRTAAAVELIHTASLAHDDMVDASTERRGVPSLHVAYGATTAVLVGDLFYSRFFQEIAALPGTGPALRLRLLEMFLGVTARMCEGEILEEQIRGEGADPSFEAYLHITGTKTADLVSACCAAGALLNGAPDTVVEALAGFGRALGLLFQIADDLADGDAAFTDRSLLVIKAEECRRTADALRVATSP